MFGYWVPSQQSFNSTRGIFLRRSDGPKENRQVAGSLRGLDCCRSCDYGCFYQYCCDHYFSWGTARDPANREENLQINYPPTKGWGIWATETPGILLNICRTTEDHDEAENCGSKEYWVLVRTVPLLNFLCSMQWANALFLPMLPLPHTEGASTASALKGHCVGTKPI